MVSQFLHRSMQLFRRSINSENGSLLWSLSLVVVIAVVFGSKRKSKMPVNHTFYVRLNDFYSEHFCCFNWAAICYWKVNISFTLCSEHQRYMFCCSGTEGGLAFVHSVVNQIVSSFFFEYLISIHLALRIVETYDLLQSSELLNAQQHTIDFGRAIGWHSVSYHLIWVCRRQTKFIVWIVVFQ